MQGCLGPFTVQLATAPTILIEISPSPSWVVRSLVQKNLSSPSLGKACVCNPWSDRDPDGLVFSFFFSRRPETRQDTSSPGQRSWRCIRGYGNGTPFPRTCWNLNCWPPPSLWFVCMVFVWYSPNPFLCTALIRSATYSVTSFTQSRVNLCSNTFKYSDFSPFGSHFSFLGQRSIQ